MSVSWRHAAEINVAPFVVARSSLLLNPPQWPLRYLDGQPLENMPEQKTLSHPISTSVKECAVYDLALRTWSKLLRILVYVFTFSKLLPRRVTTAIIADRLQFAGNKLISALQLKYLQKNLTTFATSCHARLPLIG